MSQITDEELTVMKVRLRLAGIHPTWIEWASSKFMGSERYILKYMEKVCNGLAPDGLLDTWKQPMPPQSDD